MRYKPVKEKDRELLWNINQKYLYEMTNFYDDPMDENGNHHYGYFEDCFTDPDYTMAEFTIFPAYRRNHYVLDAMEQNRSDQNESSGSGMA